MSRKLRTIDQVFCTVCDWDTFPPEETPVNICSLCVHPERVRSYCRTCHERLDFSLRAARLFFGLSKLNVWRTGIVLCFDGCLSCEKELATPPHIFYLEPSPTETQYHIFATA